jgi:hypothetical protein
MWLGWAQVRPIGDWSMSTALSGVPPIDCVVVAGRSWHGAMHRQRLVSTSITRLDLPRSPRHADRLAGESHVDMFRIILSSATYDDIHHCLSGAGADCDLTSRRMAAVAILA